MPRKPKRTINIKWQANDYLKHGFGHGVEFWYSQGEIIKRESDILVAIIEGLRWYHNPNQKWVTVKILSGNSSTLKRSDISADEILNAVRIGVKKFFKNIPSYHRVSPDVQVWWNA